MLRLTACLERRGRFPMPARIPVLGPISRVVALGIAFSAFSFPGQCQKPIQRPSFPNSNSQQVDNQSTDVSVSVRDLRGIPLGLGTIVHLAATAGSYNVTESTREASTAHFSSLPSGDYELEVSCPGYRKATERLSIIGNHSNMPVYVYMVPETDAAQPNDGPPGVVMSPQLRSEMEKSLQALRKQQYESARKLLAKAAQKAPGNPDVVYFLGVAELGLQHTDLAREDFQHALSLNPNHELALVSLGELQLQSGSVSDAISSFEKAIATGRASWRAHYHLASACLKAKRLGDAESEASRAIRMAKDKGAAPTYLLGQIQEAEGRRTEAIRTWQSVASAYPADPIADEAKTMIAHLERATPQTDIPAIASLPPPSAPEISLITVIDRPWAPPDLDSAAYETAPGVTCKTEQILDGAYQRMKSELVDFEKFTATEHIEHQTVDRNGWPGPTRAHDFSYIVLIYPLGKDSFYLEESRGDGGNDLTNFPTSLATVGLNSLGVSVVQPYYREYFDFSCEGLTNLRGQAAWQVRFEEKRGSKGGAIRLWRRSGKTYEIPIKGRIWVSSSGYAVVRVETELRDPVAGLELTKDHLFVDYGPVKFSSGNEQLWLPWSADMYMEFHGKRYHHRHFLSDYMLFGVDTTHKISKPRELPPPPEESSP
jgi:tetratricopeptide (TPR) repeat protein